MGLFIAIEGPEGAGKTTAAKRLLETLKIEGYDTIYTREPGGSSIAEQIRKIVLDIDNNQMDKRTEALLYAAARRQHLIEIVLPQLSKNGIVICDRFVDSSLAYQGHAREIGIDKVFNMNTFAIDNLMPDMTVLFDISPTLGLRRIHNDAHREINRLDKEHAHFHNRVYEGYRLLAEKYKERFSVIDATLNKEEVYMCLYKLTINKIKKLGIEKKND